jgi:hypothetical protein
MNERDAYESGYQDGFDRGQEAIMQQVDAILDDPWLNSGSEAYEHLRELSESFWKEREA